jgi:hypothetical protein
MMGFVVCNAFGVNMVEERMDMKGYSCLLGIFAKGKSDMGGLVKGVSWV